MAKDLTYEQLARRNRELETRVKILEEELSDSKGEETKESRNYKERYYRISENLSDIVFRYNLIEKKFDYISPQVEHISGYAPEDFYNNGSLLRSILHPESTRGQLDFLEKITENPNEELEYKIITKSGDSLWVQQKNFLVKDKSGQIKTIEGVISDITDKKNSEAALIESEAQKNAILNNWPHFAWLKSRDGIYLSVNESFAKYLNKKVDEVVGKHDYYLYDKARAKRYHEQDQYVINKQKQFFVEEKVKGKYWEIFKAPIFNYKKEVIGVTGIAQEITTRKRNEDEVKEYTEKTAVQNVMLKLVNDELKEAKDKAEEADRLKSAFLANMSHEIRTPMNAILGFATLLRDRKLPPEKQVNFINLINTNCRQLLSIISDIIDISKIESNQITIFNKNYNINRSLNQLAGNFEAQIKEQQKDIEIHVVCPLEEEEAQLYNDKVRIEQILTNLLSNAIKFTNKGEVELGYYFEKKNAREIVFYVKDTGIGLQAKEHKVIFDRFRQVSTSYSKEYGGTGLGLSISKGLTQKLGGKIWVESEFKKGSTFFFNLPYKKGERVKPEKILYASIYNWSGKTILIAEDEEANFLLMENILLPTKATIVWAKNGAEAVKICNANSKIDLVLMDIKMPVLNGIEATKQIKASRKQLPIIAQTAFAMSSDENNCLEAGCDDYLAKPLMVDEILKKISLYINASRLKGKA